MIDVNKRIYTNIEALLKHGAFPGEWAKLLAESQEFVRAIIIQLETKENEAGSSDQPAADKVGVASSDVRDPQRKSRAGRRKRAGQSDSGAGDTATGS